MIWIDRDQFMLTRLISDLNHDLDGLPTLLSMFVFLFN